MFCSYWRQSYTSNKKKLALRIRYGLRKTVFNFKAQYNEWTVSPLTSSLLDVTAATKLNNNKLQEITYGLQKYHIHLFSLSSFLPPFPSSFLPVPPLPFRSSFSHLFLFLMVFSLFRFIQLLLLPFYSLSPSSLASSSFSSSSSLLTILSQKREKRNI